MVKKRIWGLLVEKLKTEKGIQDFIMEGVIMGLLFIGFVIFLLIMTAVKRSLFMYM